MSVSVPLTSALRWSFFSEAISLFLLHSVALFLSCCSFIWRISATWWTTITQQV